MLRETVVETLRRWFQSSPADIVAAYLFGSVARGQERATATSTSASCWPPASPGR
jgi:predicted nucleotidyltransferase